MTDESVDNLIELPRPSFFKRLSAAHPLLFVAAYISLILIFGTIYSCMSNSFFAPYAKFEPRATKDARAIAETTASLLTKELKGDTYHFEDCGDWKFHQAFVQHVDASDGSGVTGKTILNFFDSKFSSTNVILDFHTEANPQTNAENETFIILTRPDAPQSFPQADCLINDLLVPADSRTRTPAERGIVFVSNDYFNRTLAYANGVANSDPLGISGPIRMFYFSAVVATTVGFGDIVPMTDVSRMLVACEAILAIVCAGLFLNAIAYRAGSNK